MNKEIKNKLIKIIIAIVFLIIAVSIDKLTNFNIWVNLVIYLVPYFIVGAEVIKEAIEKIFHGEFFDEDFLMSIATIGALLIGFLPDSETQFTEAVFVMLFFQIGELFEELAENNSRKSISELMDIRPDYANIEEDGIIKKVSPETVKIDEIIVIQPGEKVPMDGIVIEGKSSLNTVAITGESVPRTIKEGELINSGCININGTIKVKVTKVFSESTASKIIELVESATDKKSKSENFITKFSKYYTPIVVVAAILIAIIPPLLSSNFLGLFTVWFKRALTFLVVSCPCALVVSVPLSFFGGIGGASKKGILIKGSNYIDALSKVNTVVFDKTGTLTEGVFEVVAIHPEIFDKNKLLHLAAHVERYSTHPIAVSLKNAYKNEKDECKVTEVEEFAGQGIKAKVNGEIMYVGNSKMMERLGLEWKKCEKRGTIIHVASDEKYFGHIIISDKIKNDSKAAIKEMKKHNIKTIMLTGDKEEIGEEVAKNLKLDEFYADLFPQDKVKKLDEIINSNRLKGTTAFVGDGINDSPVLARADVGIAMGVLGSDSAIEAADVVLMDDKISKIITSIKIAKRTIKIARQNIIFAISIKLIVLILAALGIAPMWLAVFADVGVTVIAVLNAMRTLNI